MSVFALRDGKTNLEGKTNLGAITRHRDPSLCATGSLAFLMFYRFHIKGETLDLSKKRNWYHTKLFTNGRDNITELTKDAHADAVSKCFKALKKMYSKKTHVGRGSGANMALKMGASVDQIRLHGRWNNSVSTVWKYLNSCRRNSGPLTLVFTRLLNLLT